MTDPVCRGGTVEGLPPVGLSRALRTGILVGWTTAVASLRDPMRRPIGVMWGLLTVVAAWFGGILAGPLGAVAGAAAGFGGYFMVIMLVSMITEPVLFSRAPRVWFLNEPGRRGCAKAAELDSGDWRLSSVAAWPFRRGVGTDITTAVTADADRGGRAIVLTAENRRVGRLYERFGFSYSQPGRRQMRRNPSMPRTVDATDQPAAPS